MTIRAALFLILICAACQSGKIPCPEVKFAKVKHSKARANSYVGSPMASNKNIKKQQEDAKRLVDLERMKSSRVTGKEMLDKYGNVEQWDCPSPSGKKKYSKVAKENIKKNEKKMREHLKQKHEIDSIASAPPSHGR